MTYSPRIKHELRLWFHHYTDPGAGEHHSLVLSLDPEPDKV